MMRCESEWTSAKLPGRINSKMEGLKLLLALAYVAGILRSLKSIRSPLSYATTTNLPGAEVGSVSTEWSLNQVRTLQQRQHRPRTTMHHNKLHKLRLDTRNDEAIS